MLKTLRILLIPILFFILTVVIFYKISEDYKNEINLLVKEKQRVDRVLDETKGNIRGLTIENQKLKKELEEHLKSCNKGK